MKKNQVIVFVLALLLVTVGYLGIGKDANDTTEQISSNVSSQLAQNDENENLGDAEFVSGAALVPNEEETQEVSKENTSDANNTNNTDDDYFTSSRLQRETMYSQNLENYQKIINSTEISAEQKTIAQNEIIKINNEKNAIMIMENLIKTKGFSDVVIFINNKSISVVVKAEKLDVKDVAKIQNIVSRELDTEISNIHISNK